MRVAFQQQRCLQQQGIAHLELGHTGREGGTGLSLRLVTAVITVLGVQTDPQGCCMSDICFPYSLVWILPVPRCSLLQAHSPASSITRPVPPLLVPFATTSCNYKATGLCSKQRVAHICQSNQLQGDLCMPWAWRDL